MIVSLVVLFTPKEPCTLPSASGNYIHGLFLNIVRSLDEKMAEELHKDERAKPFTVSPIFGEFQPIGTANNRLLPGKNYWFRFTLLDKNLALFFIKALNENKDRSFVLAGNEMVVKDVLQDSSNHEWAGSSTHERIYDKFIVRQENIKRKILFKFLTPTTFRTEKTNLILPIPRTVFHSVLEKWDKLSSIPLNKGDFLDWLEKKCVVSRFNIKTRVWDFDKFKYIGFVGEVEFTDLEEKETAYRAIWNMLAEYCFFCGIGSKTTMGFGMSKVINAM